MLRMTEKDTKDTHYCPFIHNDVEVDLHTGNISSYSCASFISNPREDKSDCTNQANQSGRCFIKAKYTGDAQSQPKFTPTSNTHIHSHLVTEEDLRGSTSNWWRIPKRR